MDAADVAQEVSGESVLTIGYSGRSPSEFVAQLLAINLTHIVDVRSAPYSAQRPEWNETHIRGLLAEEGLGYLWLGDSLGGRPTDRSCYTADGRVDYALVQKKEWFGKGLDRVERGAMRGYRIALMCAEARPESCHRTKLVADTLHRRGHVTVAHIEGPKITPHETVMRRLTHGQLSLGIIDHRAQSRNAYPAGHKWP